MDPHRVPFVCLGVMNTYGNIHAAISIWQPPYGPILANATLTGSLQFRGTAGCPMLCLQHIPDLLAVVILAHLAAISASASANLVFAPAHDGTIWCGPAWRQIHNVFGSSFFTKLAVSLVKLSPHTLSCRQPYVLLQMCRSKYLDLENESVAAAAAAAAAAAVCQNSTAGSRHPRTSLPS